MSWSKSLLGMVLVLFLGSINTNLAAEEGPLLELQLNAQAWQLLSWDELVLLSEQRRSGGGNQHIVPLEYLYPRFREIESLDSRNLQDEFLEIKLRNLEDSYLKLEDSRKLTLYVAGKWQSAPQQINIYGSSWPEQTLVIWQEKGLDLPFLRDELEIYQRFQNLKLELEVLQNLPQAFSRAQFYNSDNLPDLILASFSSTKMLQNMLQDLSLREKKEQEGLAYLDLFYRNDNFYASPFALDSYCLAYNSDLLGGETGRPHLSQLGLSGWFRLLEEKRGKEADTPYYLGMNLRDELAFSLLLSSFLPPEVLKESLVEEELDIEGLRLGLRYLRKQGQQGLLRREKYTTEHFGEGKIAAIIMRSSELPKVIAMAGEKQRKVKQISITRLPYNDFLDHEIPALPSIWSLSIVKDSPVATLAAGLRSYLLRSVVQGEFDLGAGILPAHTAYYPLYQRSKYYPLLPKAGLRHTMDAAELWEYGIQQRQQFGNIMQLHHLFRSRIAVLMDSDIKPDLLLTDMQEQWQDQLQFRQEPIFLR